MPEWYLSFATDEKFLGATVVSAEDEISAVNEATRLGRNPGGEIAILMVPEAARDFADIKVYRTKLVGEEEALAMGGKKQKDRSKEEQEFFNKNAAMVCADCNDGIIS